MDPISRRYVWDVIQAAKPGCAIVLTTHSMSLASAAPSMLLLPPPPLLLLLLLLQA
jgi:ABC-type multidrug transport system ATPase subunit